MIIIVLDCKADTNGVSYFVRVQYFLKELMNQKLQSQAKNLEPGAPSWMTRALLICSVVHLASHPRGTGQRHWLLFLSIILACQHVLIRGWRLSSALSPGGPLRQQCRVYAGKCLVVCLWSMRVEKWPGSQPSCGVATNPAWPPGLEKGLDNGPER